MAVASANHIQTLFLLTEHYHVCHEVGRSWTVRAI